MTAKPTRGERFWLIEIIKLREGKGRTEAFGKANEVILRGVIVMYVATRREAKS